MTLTTARPRMLTRHNHEQHRPQKITFGEMRSTGVRGILGRRTTQISDEVPLPPSRHS